MQLYNFNSEIRVDTQKDLKKFKIFYSTAYEFNIVLKKQVRKVLNDKRLLSTFGASSIEKVI